MAIFKSERRRAPWQRLRIKNFTSRKLIRLILIAIAFIAIVPPIFFHFRLRRFHQVQLKKCRWLRKPPLVCAHVGDSSNAFPNTLAAYHSALSSRVDCIEIDVSRSSDGVFFALQDRELQQILGNSTYRVGHLSMKEIKKLDASHHNHHVKLDFHDLHIPTLEDALKGLYLYLYLRYTDAIYRSVQQVILDAKVGPPLFEKGLAKDIISVVERAQCRNCVVWAKSDNLARDVIKLLPDNVTVGYIVMIEPSIRVRSNLLRMRGAGIVGVYHPLIDEKLVKILHRSNKKVYAWTVDDEVSMSRMLDEHVDAIVTGNPTLLQGVMQDVRTRRLEEGFSSSLSTQKIIS